MNAKKMITDAVKEAERLRIKANISPTISVDPIDVAIEVCQCRVLFHPIPSLEGVYSPVPTPTIVIDSEMPTSRQSNTCAHELGHHILENGTRIDDVKSIQSKRIEELSAELFAGYFLMPKLAVKEAITQRGFVLQDLTPEQAYRIACYFGVGYSNLLTYMNYSLRMIPYRLMKALQNVQLKEIKANYFVSPQVSMIMVDTFWVGRAINLKVGDFLLAPINFELEAAKSLRIVEEVKGLLKFEAIAPGYNRIFESTSGWTADIRVSRKNYVGLARYRFLEEVEE